MLLPLSSFPATATQRPNAVHQPLHQQHRLLHAARRPDSHTVAALPGADALAGLPIPPLHYNYKADIMAETQAVILSHYPQLQDLVDQGNLVIWQRPAGYSERRRDGYQEPGLIFMLGTAHVSASSAVEVHRLVQAVQPGCVVVELCKSRVGVLSLSEQELHHEQQLAQQVAQQWPQQQQQQQPASGQQPIPAAAASSDSVTSTQEETAGSSPAAASSSPTSPASSSSGGKPRQAPGLLSLSGSSMLGAMTRSAQLGGQSGLLLRLLMAGQVKKAADQLGVQPGAEFRAAAVAADAAGASLVLGDRPIEITLQRAWGALSWQRRLQLLSDLALASAAPQEQITADTVEQLRSDDAITMFFGALSKQYPELVAPLIAERDLYLAWSLRRSKAVNGASAVVGIVGKGHLRGVTYALKHDSSGLRFADLVGGKNSRSGRRAAALGMLQRLLVEGLLGLGLYAAWVAATAAGGAVGAGGGDL